MPSKDALFTLAMCVRIFLCFSLLATSAQCLKSPPSLIEQPPTELLFEIDDNPEHPKSIILECAATGYPEPVYSWRKNGEVFDYQNDTRVTRLAGKGTLVILAPRRADAGTYQCIAQNQYGRSLSNMVQVRKAKLGNFADADAEIHVVQALEGEPFTLHCNSPPRGYPKPVISWILQDRNTGALQSINNSRISVDPEGSLHFSNVTQEDASNDWVYGCIAASAVLNTYRIGARTSLQVKSISGSEGLVSPIKQYLSPERVVALNGSSLELFCVFGGTPLPQVHWTKVNGTIDGQDMEIQNFGKSLLIEKVTFDHGGTYECTIFNHINQNQTYSIEVIVESAPYWIRVPKSIINSDLRQIEFNCEAGGVPLPNVSWFKNGQPLISNDRIHVSGSRLSIKHVIEDIDTAAYQCNATNQHGHAFTDFYLNALKFVPKIVEFTEPETKVVENSDVVIRCGGEAEGSTAPSITWQKDGVPIVNGSKFIATSTELRISNILPADQGEYKCLLGAESKQTKLRILNSTQITSQPENLEVPIGQPAVFRCNASVDPELVLKIDWKVNGSVVDLTENPRIQVKNNSLTINSTVDSDSGVYSCVASTDLDSITASASLIVQDVPPPPKITKVSCNSVLAVVEWSARRDPRYPPILYYDIEYSHNFEPHEWNILTEIPATETKYVVPLSPFARYSFRVLARNKIGLSHPSRPYGFCSTQKKVPHKNPDNVTGRGEAPGTLFISWNEMKQIEHNADGFMYKVFWKRADVDEGHWNRRLIKNWRQNFTTVEDLPIYKPYRIRVEAWNEKGHASVKSVEVIGYSGEAKPKKAPTNFRLVEIKSPNIAVFAWNPVSPESVQGEFKGYKVIVSVESETDPRVETFPPEVSQATVSILKPNALNKIKLVVMNSMYESDPSNELEVTMPNAVPGSKIPLLETKPMGSHALFLRWKQPEALNGSVLSYKLFYQAVNNSALGLMQERLLVDYELKQMGLKLGGLASATKYRLAIFAETQIGKGEPCLVETETANDSVVEPPDKPTFEAHYERGTDSIRVQWCPQCSKNPGSDFLVQYRPIGSMDFRNWTRPSNDSTIANINQLEGGKTYEVRLVTSVDGRYETVSEVKMISTVVRQADTRTSLTSVACTMIC